jgi:haloacetate dehalogenase
MAAALVDAMRALGHDRFLVGSHDRGARVAHRMALDHPERVERLAVLDIAPTREMYRGTTNAFARAYWHWFFLIQAPPLPALRAPVGVRAGADHPFGERGFDLFDPRALDAYLRAFRDPAVIEASCEDYRAAATVDIAHDDADAGRKLGQPVLCLWGEFGVIERCFDPLALWRERGEDVRGWIVPSGHYLAEEAPDEVADAFRRFFGSVPLNSQSRRAPKTCSCAARSWSGRACASCAKARRSRSTSSATAAAESSRPPTCR